MSSDGRPRDRGMIAVLATTVAVLVVFGFDLLPYRALGAAGAMVSLALQVWAAVLSRQIAALPTTTRAARRFWRVMAASAMCFGAGSVAALVVSVRDPGSVARSESPAQAALIGVASLILIVAIFTTPSGVVSGRERVRFWLDVTTVMVGVAVLVWQFSGPTTDQPETGDLVRTLIGPAALVVVAFGVVRLALGHSAPMTRLAGGVGTIPAVLYAINEAAKPWMVDSGHVSWRAGIVVLTNVGFAAGLRIQWLQSSSGSAAGHAPEKSYNRMPYVAVLANYAAAVWVLHDTGLGLTAWVVLVGALVGSALVVARQLAAFADNDDLVTRLNAKVDELAEARDVLQRAVQERDALAERLRHLAYHDALTGLANRTLFLDRLQAELAGGGTPTVLMLDLDGFKPVNDRYGHNAGDQLLQTVALRLSRCLRDHGTVARLGGDEFAILLPSDQPTDVPGLVRRLTGVVAEPVALGPTRDAATASVRVSIGTATARPGTDLTTLLHEADLEMYAAKRLKVDQPV
ncbi:GGDEF domain-containing protein [Virgisporangium aurantiacum]|nr:GGDEF domain-containing protein [Virgisporangium aurantiacum]